MFLLIFYSYSLFVFGEEYVHGQDSHEQANVPKGKIIDFTLEDSKIYPDTIRRYSIYIPAQYKGEAAALMVFQDGHAFLKKGGHFRATTVMDNLIHQKRIPITIGVFVDPAYTGDVLL
ncbi:hypothetical protein PQO01_07575 [Lentisphaera marina]|uniref:hypothetical protein n=1 Tax=Lentisphaera marina TaxID=1111041 RepID=UPI0023655829|nr:hypothetical protein [Lentisphaera marina]MDD7984804.1 hypothetical protein [Lentisphaera marina]